LSFAKPIFLPKKPNLNHHTKTIHWSKNSTIFSINWDQESEAKEAKKITNTILRKFSTRGKLLKTLTFYSFLFFKSQNIITITETVTTIPTTPTPNPKLIGKEGRKVVPFFIFFQKIKIKM
jgi:hypothetical protein